MTDNNLIDLTNEDIISSLKLIATTRNCNECKIRNCKWGTCNCEQITANVALDFIERQKIENKRLEKEVNLVSIQFQDLQERYEESQAKIERLQNTLDDVLDRQPKLVANAEKYIVEEFANKIKNHKQRMFSSDWSGDYQDDAVRVEIIDNLVKEMVGQGELE